MPDLQSVSFSTEGWRPAQDDGMMRAWENVPALRTIFKLPQQLHGMSYIGAWTIPRKSFSFVVKVCCAEHGTTGIRDAVVAAKIQLPHGEDDPFQGWFQSLFMPSKFILLNIHRPSSVMHSA